MSENTKSPDPIVATVPLTNRELGMIQDGLQNCFTQHSTLASHFDYVGLHDDADYYSRRATEYLNLAVKLTKETKREN